MSKEFEDTPLDNVDWDAIKQEDLKDHCYFSKFFLETRDTAETSFDWMSLLDQDSINYLIDIFTKTCDNEPWCEDEISDFIIFSKALYMWDKKVDKEKEEPLDNIANIVGVSAITFSLLKKGLVKVCNHGNGSIFSSELSFVGVE